MALKAKTPMFQLVTVFLALYCHVSIGDTINLELSVNTTNIVANVPALYYGFTFDWWRADDPIYGKKWGNAGILTVDLSNPDLIALTKEITPAILRIGGSPQDGIIYNISGECNNPDLPKYNCSQADTSDFYGCLNVTRWKQIIEFATQTGVSLVFGLNCCYGRPSPSEAMNFSNIEALFKATLDSANDIDISNLLGFEFGNEIHATIDARAYAKDYVTLNGLINKYFTTQRMETIGPDDYTFPWSAQVMANLSQMAGNDLSKVMYRMTYHEYPSCAYPNGNVSVLDVTCLANTGGHASEFSSMAKTYNMSTWMGEGAEHAGGGLPNVSDTYADTFYYVYQLSYVLLNGLSGTVRADLMGADYELINRDTIVANPDYWILYIMKNLIYGNGFDRMYETKLNVTNEEYVRGFVYGNSNNDNLVIALINFSLQNTAIININVDNKKTYKYNEYHILPIGDGGLQTITMKVNDVLMEYKNGKFPKLQPVIGNGVVTLSPARIAFVALTT